MSRFLIRNYGPSRQIPYEDQQICLSNDQCIETDDEEMAGVLGEEKLIHVTDRGIEAAAPVLRESLAEKERKVTVDDSEAVHNEKFPDEDEDVQEQQTDESQQTASVKVGDSCEIPYDEMTVKELRDLAEDREIEFPEGYVKKGEIIEALEDYDAKEE